MKRKPAHAGKTGCPAQGECAPPEREQHGADLHVVNGVQSVRTAVAAMLADRTIGAAEQLAADRWYREYALVVHGASDNAGGSGNGGFEGFMGARIDAGRSLQAANEAVGPDGVALLQAYVAHELSILNLAGTSGAARSWLAGFLAATLRTLAHHYANPPRRQRPAAAQMAA